MHDQAIESRTRLQLEKATQQQAQELEDFKQERLLARASKQRQEDSLTFEHRLQQEARQREAALEAEQAQRAAHREQARLDAEQQALLAAAADARQREHLSNLRELGVDLTALLTQHRADKVIEVRGNSSTPHLHLDR
jgi:phage repressor protein C with HTH and peptisase S24 domain